MSRNDNLFSFRLPIELMDWFAIHAPDADSRHLRMRRFVTDVIQKQPDYTNEKRDEIAELRAEMEALREWVSSLVRSPGAVSMLTEANQQFIATGEIPDDLIDNMLDGLK